MLTKHISAMLHSVPFLSHTVERTNPNNGINSQKQNKNKNEHINNRQSSRVIRNTYKYTNISSAMNSRRNINRVIQSGDCISSGCFGAAATATVVADATEIQFQRRTYLPIL